MPGIGEAHGLAGALDGVVEEWAAEAGGDGEARQELLDLGDADVTGRLDAPSPISALFAPRRAPGRPKGAKGKAATTLSQFILRQHRHPVQAAAEFYSMSPADLAARLGLTKARVTVKDGETSTVIQLDEFGNDTLLELVKLQVRMMEFVAKYVARAMPQDVAVSGGADFTLTVGGVSLPARAADPGRPAGEGAPRLPVRFGPMSDAPSRTDEET